MSTVLATPDHLPELRAALADAPRVAVDTEFHAERRFLPQLLLVQVHIEGPRATTWVLDPLVDGLMIGAAEALSAVPWIVHGGRHDLELLQVALGRVPERVLDTQIAAGLLRPDFPAGYATLVADRLEVRVDKSATLSDWSRRPLTLEQVRYASRDVELLPRLWDHLEHELQERGRRELAYAACAEARDTALVGPGAQELLRELAGLPHLDPEQGAVAQELVLWREEVARATDQPARSLLADSLIVDLAKRQPLALERMLDNRRFPKALARRWAPEWIDAIHRARRRPPETTPRFVRAGTETERVADLLCLWAQVIGHRDRFSARLVLPRPRLESVALLAGAGIPAAADVHALLGPWRAELVGAALTRVVESGVTLSYTPGTPIHTAWGRGAR